MRTSQLVLVLAVVSLVAMAAEKPRVFITDSDSWQITGGAGGGANAAAGAVKGGARPQTVEIMKTFSKRCSEITVTLKQERADYIVLLDHEGGKSALSKDNKVAVFNKDGDMIHSGSTRSLGNAVKNACKAIRNDLSAAE